jgi:hypothetical protein
MRVMVVRGGQFVDPYDAFFSDFLGSRLGLRAMQRKSSAAGLAIWRFV